MFSDNDKISLRQMQIMFILNIFGTGIIILPRHVAEDGGHNGWLIVVWGVLIAVVLSAFLNLVARFMHGLSFVEMSKFAFGKILGYLIANLYALKIAVGAALELRIFAEIIRAHLLPLTPISVTMLTMLAAAALLSYNGMEARARVGEVLIFVVLLPLLPVFIIACFGADFTNLMPLLVFDDAAFDLRQLGMSAVTVCLFFRGLQEILLIYPFVNKTEGVQRSYLAAVIFGGLFMLAVAVVTISRFGADDTRAQIWPFLQMMDSIKLPGNFVEKQNAFIMSFWVVSVFMIVSGGLYFAAYIMKKNAESGGFRPFIAPFCVIVYIVALLPKNAFDAVSFLITFDLITGGIFFVAIPVLMLIFAQARRLLQ